MSQQISPDLIEALRLSDEATRLSAEMHLRHTREQYRRLTNPTRIERLDDRLSAWGAPINLIVGALMGVAAAILAAYLLR